MNIRNNPEIYDRIVELHRVKPRLVFDIGGFIGNYADSIYRKFNCEVWQFEPCKEYANICRERFKDNPKIKVFETALGNSNGEATMYLKHYCTTIIKDWTENKEPTLVPIKKLSEFMTDEVDIIKMNCEGAEYQLIQNLDETGWLPKVKELLIQFHRIPNHVKLIEEAKEILSKTHTLNASMKWELWTLK